MFTMSAPCNPDKLKLHVGCGAVYFDGWVNVDRDSGNADLKLDLREPLPFRNDSVDFIYNEHFIEHLSIQEGLDFLRECNRLLKPGGVIRIATPDLTYIILRYFFYWKRQDWIKRYGYEWVSTRAEMINIAFREWGHQHLYNEEELQRRLREAGFKAISRRRFSKSGYPELSGRETRYDSKLIMEAVKQ